MQAAMITHTLDHIGEGYTLPLRHSLVSITPCCSARYSNKGYPTTSWT